MFVQLVLAIVLCVTYTQGFVLECEFGNEEWINLGIVFQCKVQGMHLVSRNSITEVVGAPFRPIRDVRALDVQDQRCQFVPSDVQTFFPNIEGLQVANSELKELQNTDMQQFPNLKQLFMSENELQSLENDVFEPCPNIEYVNLGHNNIMHMGTDIFAPLKNLQYCNFAGNGCLDTKMESPNAIQQFSKDLENKCPPTPEMLKREKERKIPESLRTAAPPTTTTTTVAPELEDLKEELEKLKSKIAEHDQEIDEIKSKENTTASPEMPPPNVDVNDSPSTISPQGTPVMSQPNSQSPPTDPFNPTPYFNNPLSSIPPDYNLMNILNIPMSQRQYPTQLNQPQTPNELNNFPMPAGIPQYPFPFPQNVPSQFNNMPPQCGPYGCTFQNDPPQMNSPPMPYANPLQPPDNILPNQFQRPYPYNPYDNRLLPLPESQNPQNSETPQNSAPQEPQTDNLSSPKENQCGQYGCPPLNQQSSTTPPELPKNPSDSQIQNRAPHRNLDVESGLSGMFGFFIY